MANQNETRPREGGSAVDRSDVLSKVMEVLPVKGFAKATTADLTSGAGLGYRRLREAFGTREEVIRAAIRFFADAEASLAHEPLRISPTGKEAFWQCEKRMCVYAGIGQDIADAYSCSMLLSFHQSSLGFRVLDGAPPGHLFRTNELFVEALRFRARRRPLAQRCGNDAQRLTCEITLCSELPPPAARASATKLESRNRSVVVSPGERRRQRHVQIHHRHDQHAFRAPPSRRAADPFHTYAMRDEAQGGGFAQAFLNDSGAISNRRSS
jgi:AcrR family transcriptional regulator